MSTPTPRLGLVKPATTDQTSTLRTAITTNAAELDSAVLYDEGPAASRPVSTPGSPGIAGRMYRSTDLDVDQGGRLEIDTGAAWERLATQRSADNAALVFALALA